MQSDVMAPTELERNIGVPEISKKVANCIAGYGMLKAVGVNTDAILDHLRDEIDNDQLTALEAYQIAAGLGI